MKNLTLKIACLVVAILVWIQVAATTQVEADVSLPLEVAGLDGDWTVAGSDLPEQVNVRLRTPRLSLLAHEYAGRSLGAVRMDLTSFQPGPETSYLFKLADVRTESEVVSLLAPVRVSVRVDWRQTERLPVVVPLTGQLPASLLMAEPPRVMPDSVEVSGPRRFFREIEAVSTPPIDLGDVTGPVTRELSLEAPPDPLSCARSSVTVRLPVVALDERVVANVPVLATSDGRLAEAGVSPPVCDVLVRGPADSVSSLVAGRLRVRVPVGDLAAGVHQVVGEVDHPEWVMAVRLEPATFMVIVEEPVRVEGSR